MYLFLLYLVVHFVNEVDLWDPTDNRVHDRAAETAKLIDIVQKTDSFEVKYPLKSNERDDGRNKDKIADDLDLFETMKLLQKNYDVNRKFNEIPKQARLQYISNPEVLEIYKNLGDSRQHTEVYDDLDNQDSSPRSYFKELSELRYFRTNNKNITEIRSVKDDNDDAAEEAKALNKRRHIGEEQNSEGNGSASETWSNNSEEVNKHSETFNLVKPIVAEMLAKYAIKASQEESTEIKRNQDLNTSAKKNNSEIKNVHIESEQSDESTQTETAETNLDVKHIEKQKQVAISEKNTGSFTSDEQKNKNKNKNELFIIKNSNEENNSKNDRTVPNNSISTKKENIDPTVTIEDNTSEEIKNDSNNKKRNSSVNIKQADNKDKERMKKTKSKPQKIKNKRENESENGDTRVSMEEKVIDWGDYGKKKKTNEHDSEIDNENSNKNTNQEKVIERLKKNKKIVTNIENENENNEHNDYSRYKSKVSTKRKGDWNEENDSWDQKYDDGNKNENISSKKLSSFNKKEDLKQKNDWNKKGDYDLNNNNNKSNKKKDVWNKKDIDWNKKEDDWNKKEDDSYVKQENKRFKKKDWSKNDDAGNNNLKTAGNLKRDNAWDSVGNNKNSGWGSYDSFKNILEKKNINLKDNISQEEITKPTKDFTVPKRNSWDNYATKRDDYYEKPKRQGRMTMYRTPIPIVGKRPLYAD